MRTIPDISSLFQPLEDAIRLQLLPSLTGHTACSAIECDLFSLPCRFGGLGVANPTSICDSQFAASIQITAPLKKLIIEQSISAQPLMSVPSRLRFTRISMRLPGNVHWRFRTVSLCSFSELLI